MTQKATWQVTGALIHLAKLIRHYADENCVTARLGGDEFMLYFTEDAEKKRR